MKRYTINMTAFEWQQVSDVLHRLHWANNSVDRLDHFILCALAHYDDPSFELPFNVQEVNDAVV